MQNTHRANSGALLIQAEANEAEARRLASERMLDPHWRTVVVPCLLTDTDSRRRALREEMTALNWAAVARRPEGEALADAVAEATQRRDHYLALVEGVDRA